MIDYKDKIMAETVICVLGMHRSGTSCLTGSLEQRGVYLGDVFTSNPHNLKGNRENGTLMELNESVLQANGGSWLIPPPMESIKWTSSQQQKLCDFFSSYSGYDFWGFKDPRSLILYREIRRCMPNMLLVGTFRNPYSVIHSLLKRNPGLATENELLRLWKVYNDNMLTIWKESNFPILDFDDSDEVYLDNFDKLCSTIGCNNISNTIGNSRFFDPDLRSHISSNNNLLPKDILHTYNRLKGICLK